MPLEPGHDLRQYRILAAIGQGGMGEVYRARDTNLDRDVAIKVLPQEVADKPLNLARLEREAKAVAALSHPNILAVHDLGREGGTAFVVTELLEGETLRDRLTRSGAFAPRKVAELGRQIARGLAAAHDKGIVHRDIKPENLFLTEDGRVKILDFGLAAEGGQDPTGGDGATRDDATRTSLTAPGTVLGTVDYMSPEQARGEPVDHRSDIFSLGSVLYEMISGIKPFHRDTQPETMTAVLREDPVDVSSTGEGIPPALATIVRRCQEKRPGERFQSAHDLAFSLEALSDSTVSTGAAAAMAGVRTPRPKPRLGRAAALLAIGLAIGAGATWLLAPQPEPLEPPNFAVLSARRGTVTNARFAPGEDSILYSAKWDGGSLQLFPVSRNTRSAEPMSLEGADLLAISPTGELALALDRRYPVGWEAIGTLAVAQPGRAAPRELLEDVLVADWGPDGQLAVAHEVGGVVRVEYPIGTVVYEAPGWISDLRVHPDGDRILIADNAIRGDNFSLIKIVHLGGEVETLLRGGSWGVLWAPDGETIWFADGRAIRAVRPGEEARRIYELPTATRLLDIDADGRLLIANVVSTREMFVRAHGVDAETDISWLDWSTPRGISDDGRWVVFEEGNDATRDGYGIYLRDTVRDAPLHLGYGTTVALSPDAGWIAAVIGPFGDEPRMELVPTGVGERVPIEIGNVVPNAECGTWLPGQGPGDRGELIFAGRNRDGVVGMYHLPLSGDATPRAITPEDLPLATVGHAVSPDGTRVVVNPARGTPVEFGLDGTGPRPLPGVEPDDQPLRFDRDGTHLFVMTGSSISAPIVRVELATGRRSPWRELTPADPAGVSAVDRVHLSADGTAYVYSTRRQLSNVALMTGLQD